MKTITKDLLKAEIFENRDLMGKKAAEDIANKINELLKEKETINVIFAAAPSQLDMIAYLIKCDVDWSRINAFHMDEYIGLKEDAPQGFGNFLAKYLFDKVPFKSVNYINGQTDDIEKECERYSKLLKDNPVDIVCLGIGENGHIAFNDPDMADFNDKKMVKPVELDDICRQQQVNDGCFADISEVPRIALTLTVPTLFAGKHLFCVVPAKTKADAVREVMSTENIDEHCPATIMRKHSSAIMYCDADSGEHLFAGEFNSFKLGIINDEVSQDFEEAVRFAKEHRLECMELRSSWEKNPFQYTDEDFRIIAEILDKYKMPLVCISSPMFKCSYFDEKTKNEHIEGLKRLLEYSDILGFKMIRCFDFIKEDGVTMEMIAEAFEEPIRLCKEAGITLVLESEPSANSFNSETTAQTVKYINSPVLKALYEPGNTIYSDTDEIPFPDGYNKVKDVFCHIHIKDAVRKNGETIGVAIGSGIVDYEGMIKELITSNYDGAIIFEPHYKPNGAMSEELLRNPQGSQISEMGDIASRECILALNDIIEKVKRTLYTR